MESTTAVRKYYSEIDVARGFVLFLTVFAPVSYTHLDVYKRQGMSFLSTLLISG